MTDRYFTHTRRVLLTWFLCGFFSLHAHAADVLLPDLGDASSGLVTPNQEYVLGQKWLRLFRSRVALSQDPFLQSYVESLLQKLSYYSELQDKRLDVLVVENPTLNAFAVPGGIIGVHTGLFEHADNEDQFAGVLAHELAHLSQRHYARRVADQSEKTIPMMAAMLGSILIAATAGTEAGIAAMSATQAASLGSQLHFSREMEKEADRIGMDTLVNAGKDPLAMGAMFENMLKASRYSRRPPEFLLTHPLTESRVSDTRLRAQQFKKKHFEQNEEFEFVKVHARLAHIKNHQKAVREFKETLKSSSTHEPAALYGMTISLIRAGKLEDAEKILAPLIKDDPKNLYFLVAQSEIDAEKKQFDSAIQRLKKELERFPRHHALNIRTAEILMKASRYKECESLLLQHSKRRPKDDYVWYLLAEVHGLAGDIFSVHTARAEYFLLNGIYDKAIIQLQHARQMVGENEALLAKIEHRIKYAKELKADAKL